MPSETQDTEENWTFHPNDTFNDLEEKVDHYTQKIQKENSIANELERRKEKRIILTSQRDTEYARINESIKNITALLEDALLHDTREKAIMIEEMEKGMENVKKC